MKTAEHKKHLLEANVVWNRCVGAAYYHMGIKCPHVFQTAFPGQFVMVRPKLHAQPLLRRPFSIHNLIRTKDRVDGFEILYKVIGVGTEKLSLCRKGDTIDVLGPLGKGFSRCQDTGDVYLAAGGIGVAPFNFLANDLLRWGVEGSRITLFLGGQSKQDLLGLNTFERLGIGLQVATDDGSAGVQGLVTLPLEEAIQTKKPGILYACGPVAMLKKVTMISKAYDVRCEISIEAMMACGMGACLGCAVENHLSDKKYLHACVDGPVFDAKDILL
jgi:dihydroorotate dehydrogenase electron transfer subunit